MKQLVSSTTKTPTQTPINRPSPTISRATSTTTTTTTTAAAAKSTLSLAGCLLVVALMLLCLIVGPTEQQPTNGQATATSSGIAPATGSEQVAGKGIFKRSFAGLGCLGVYDKAKFARLDRVCEECYQLYREPDIHMACRQDCFRNSVFTRCVDALLLSHEQKKFDEMVDELYGK